MCFYTEHEGCCLRDEIDTAERRTRCQDCGRWIEAGATYHAFVWADRSQCRICDADWDDHQDRAVPCIDEETDEESPDAEHDFGDVSRGAVCMRCDRVRNAVEAHEIASGCSPYESQPDIGDLWDSLAHEGERYGRAILAACPDLIADSDVMGLFPRRDADVLGETLPEWILEHANRKGWA